MSLPITSLCSNGSASYPYAISGNTIYQGSTPIVNLNHSGVRSSVSCTSFWSPYLVICAGQTIFVYKCIDDSLSFYNSTLCPTMVLSMLPGDDLWLLSFINGDWGCLDVSTCTLSCHKGSTGVFFSSHFLGILCNQKALLALGSAAPLIELCLINLEQLTYIRIATVPTVSFPVLCIKSYCPPATDCSSDSFFLLLALSCKHAHVFSLTISETNDSSIIVHTDGWPILENTSRLYTGYLDSIGIYLGDETGDIHRYAYTYQHGSSLLSTLDYRLSLHGGIVKDMLMLNNSLYTCGEDGTVLSHDFEDYSHNSKILPLESVCTEIADTSRKRGSVYLHSSMVYTNYASCIVVYMCDKIIISNFKSVLIIPLPGQKPNSFDEFVNKECRVLITVGYTISAIYCIEVSISPFEVSSVVVLDLSSQLQECGTINRKIPKNLGISSCHLLQQNNNTVELFVFVHGVGGVIVSCKHDLSTVVSISIHQYFSSADYITVLNVETGVTSSHKTNKPDLEALGPLTSSIIRFSNGSSLISVYSKDGQLQMFNYVHRNLQLLFPILDLCADDNRKMKVYTRLGSHVSQCSCNHDKNDISFLFISRSGRIRLIQISVCNNKVVLNQQNMTRSILPCNSFLLTWEKHIVIASRNAKEWIITSLHPDSFTYIQGTISMSNLPECHRMVGSALGMSYNNINKQCFLFNWSFPRLGIYSVRCPILTTNVIKPGLMSNSEINAFVLVKDMLICGSETGEVILYDIDMNFIKIIYYCNASVRSIAVSKISSEEALIIVGSSNSQLVCLILNIENTIVTGCTRLPVRYTQPRASELDIRYTCILPLSDLSANSHVILFLVGVSIGELWLMCFVSHTRCIYIVERCSVNSVPMQLQWMQLETERYIISAMTQGLSIASIDRSKLLTVSSKFTAFNRMNIGYTEHVLSHKPIGSVCGENDIIIIKWQVKSTLYSSITSILVFEHSILALSDIGYLLLYVFKKYNDCIQLINKNILQSGCIGGIICATNLAFENDASFVYVGWDRVPYYCKVSGLSSDTIILSSYSLPSIPLYNIHSVLCVHASEEACTVIFCGSGLFTISIPREYLLTGRDLNELNKIDKP